MEKIVPMRHHTKWRPQFKIHIVANKEDAIKEEWRDGVEVKIFTDSSGIEQKIGAAAVLFRQNCRQWTLCHHLGAATAHTVYEGEIVGMGLATELLRTERRVLSASIYVDNQASIQSTQTSRSRPGHYLLDHLHEQMKRVIKQHPNLHLKICWIPGHCNVWGNEVIDEEVKKAALEGSSEDGLLPTRFRSRKALPTSKLAAK